MSICINSLNILDICFFVDGFALRVEMTLKFFFSFNSRDNTVHSSFLYLQIKFFFFCQILFTKHSVRLTDETPCVSPLANCHIDSTIVLLFITFLSFFLCCCCIYNKKMRGSQPHA